jgi:multimeric flavodoxin WrbA
MKITAIVGSPRSNGNTSCLVDEALQEVSRQGLETEKIMLGDHRVGPCLGHENCPSFSECLQKDDAAWILEKFREADGIILGSPVYYYTITAQMKTFIDRNYFLYTHGIPLEARCAGTIAVAGGAGLERTDRDLRRFARMVTSLPEEKVVSVSGYASKPGDVRSDASLLEDARALGTKMVKILTIPEITLAP